MWAELFELTASAAALATLPGTAYLAMLSAAAARPVREASPDGASAPPRVVLLVPAHNESSGLLRTLRSLKAEIKADRQGGASARVVVVADNCSDDTAAQARGAGVEVLERNDAQRRGKGHALNHAFERIRDADWFVVIDADTDVQPGFLGAMRRAMQGGAVALQCRYRVRDAHRSQRATLADVALGGWNVLRPRGRAGLGLSAGILGNGFALSRQALDLVPYSATSIVEDAEYHLLLLRAGLRVDWVDAAEVRGDMPSGAAAASQRARWEGGRLRLLQDQGLPLLRQSMSGRWRLLDPLFDLLLPPLSWQLALLGLSLAAGVQLGQSVLLWIAGAGLAVIGAHVLLALVLIGADKAHWRALAGVPRYLVWKLALAAQTWRQSGRRAAWVRSSRG